MLRNKAYKIMLHKHNNKNNKNNKSPNKFDILSEALEVMEDEECTETLNLSENEKENLVNDDRGLITQKKERK